MFLSFFVLLCDKVNGVPESICCLLFLFVFWCFFSTNKRNFCSLSYPFLQSCRKKKKKKLLLKTTHFPKKIPELQKICKKYAFSQKICPRALKKLPLFGFESQWHKNYLKPGIVGLWRGAPGGSFFKRRPKSNERRYSVSRLNFTQWFTLKK